MMRWSPRRARYASSPASFSVPGGRGSSERDANRAVTRSNNPADKRPRSRSAERWTSTRYAGTRASDCRFSWRVLGCTAAALDHFGERASRLPPLLPSLSCEQRLHRIVQMLQLIDEPAILIDVEKDRARLTALREVQRSPATAQARQNVRHLRSQLGHCHELAAHSSIVRLTVPSHVLSICE